MMIKIRFSFVYLLAIGFLGIVMSGLVACGDAATDSAADQDDTDAMEAAEPEEVAAQDQVNTLILHEVEDYDRWKEGFDEAYALRKDAGELSYEVGTAHGDPNMVYVFNSWAKAEDFHNWMGDPELKAKMQELGVKGPPTFIVFEEKNSSAMRGDKVKTMIYHPVQDFDQWYEGFTGFQPKRSASGELSHEVGVFADDPDMVYVINEWDSVEKFQAFFQDASLKKAMEEAGVAGPPQVIIFDKKDSGT